MDEVQVAEKQEVSVVETPAKAEKTLEEQAVPYVLRHPNGLIAKLVERVNKLQSDAVENAFLYQEYVNKAAVRHKQAIIRLEAQVDEANDATKNVRHGAYALVALNVISVVVGTFFYLTK